MKKNPKNSGFTLVEVIVVVAIIGILASIVGVVATNLLNKADMAACQAEMRNIVAALQKYKADTGYFPVDRAEAAPALMHTNPQRGPGFSIPPRSTDPFSTPSQPIPGDGLRGRELEALTDNDTDGSGGYGGEDEDGVVFDVVGLFKYIPDDACYKAVEYDEVNMKGWNGPYMATEKINEFDAAHAAKCIDLDGNGVVGEDLERTTYLWNKTETGVYAYRVDPWGRWYIYVNDVYNPDPTTTGPPHSHQKVLLISAGPDKKFIWNYGGGYFGDYNEPNPHPDNKDNIVMVVYEGPPVNPKDRGSCEPKGPIPQGDVCSDE